MFEIIRLESYPKTNSKLNKKKAMDKDLETQSNIAKKLKQIICDTAPQQDRRDRTSYVLLASIKVMIKSLNLALTSVHLTDTYIAKTLDGIDLNTKSMPEINSAVFNLNGKDTGSDDDVMFYFDSLIRGNKKKRKPFLLCLLQGNANNNNNDEYLKSLVSQKVISSKLILQDPLKFIDYAASKESVRQYCVFPFTHYNNPPTIPEIIEAMNEHVENEYLNKSLFKVSNPFVRSCPPDWNNVTYKSNNFLSSLQSALYNVCRSEKGKALVNVVNIHSSSGIIPSSFSGTTYKCFLKMFINVHRDKYLPIPKEFYFPRVTYDNDALPQIHKLCFAVVRNHEASEWNIITLTCCQRNLTASDVIDNAYALVYLSQEAFVYSGYVDWLKNKYKTPPSMNQLKERLHPILLRDYYEHDNRLAELVSAFQQWTNTGKLFRLIQRYILLSGDYEKKGNSERILSYNPYIK